MEEREGDGSIKFGRIVEKLAFRTGVTRNNTRPCVLGDFLIIINDVPVCISVLFVDKIERQTIYI